MKKLLLYVVLVAATATTFAQKVLYTPAMDSATTYTSWIAESATPGDFYVFNGIPGRTLVSLQHANGVVDTITTIPLIPTTSVAYGQYLFLAGTALSGDSAICSIKSTDQSVWYPDSFPQGTITALAAVPSGVLVGGNFTVSNSTTTYTNFARINGQLAWTRAGFIYQTGTDWGVSALRTLVDSVYIGVYPITEDSVFYIRMTLGGNFADTLKTNFAPTGVGPALWTIVDFAKDDNGNLFTALDVYDTVPKFYLCKGQGSGLVSYHYFNRATPVVLKKFRHGIWGALSSSQAANHQYKVFSVTDNTVVPRFLTSTGGNGNSVSCFTVEYSGYQAVVGGNFGYILDTGDTLRNSVALSVADTLAPEITLTGDTVTIFVGSSYIEPGYSALDNFDASVAVQVSGSVNANLVGAYVLTYTAADSSGNVAIAQRVVNVVDTPTGIWEVNNDLSWNAYPNPTQGQVIITSERTGIVSVTNSIGEVIASISINGTQTRETLSVPPGMYLLRFESAHAVSTKRLIITK